MDGRMLIGTTFPKVGLVVEHVGPIDSMLLLLFELIIILGVDTVAAVLVFVVIAFVINFVGFRPGPIC